MLEVKDLKAGYRGIQALKGVSLSVAAGEMVAIIGANGAGKSTLLNTLSAIVPASGGRIEFDGQDITGGTGVDRFRDMFDSEVARASAGRTGFGIAEAVERQFGRYVKDR